MYISIVRVLKNTGHLFPKGQDTLPSYLLKSQCRQILGWSFPIHLKYDRGHTALTCVKSPSDGKLSPVYVPSNTSHTFRVVISRIFIVLRKKHTKNCLLGSDSIKRCHLTSIGNPIVEIRRSYDRLISTMGFPIRVRQHLYIELGPRWFSLLPTLDNLPVICC